MEFIILPIGLLIVLSALGVLLTRDNLYASLYMSITLILIATVYAAFDIQPVFILITFVFVGAIGAVTVALSAIYRAVPVKFSIEKIWILPIAITVTVLGYTLATYANLEMEIAPITIANWISKYLLLILFLISLLSILMLCTVKLSRSERID
jgi:NADH-quinone oxidoreductase subunit J